jgi:predicted transcriptional regulator
MTLEQYLAEKQIKPVAFAASISVAPSTITRILRGERTPRIELISKIKHATGGVVTADDWMEAAEAEAEEEQASASGRAA